MVNDAKVSNTKVRKSRDFDMLALIVRGVRQCAVFVI